MEVKEKVGVFKTVAFTMSSVSRAVAVISMGYLTYYATNILGMTPALVGTLLLVSKLFDGFTDVIMGAIVDKTNTKLGKARPYELAIVGIWLCTWLMFSCPKLGAVGNAAWLFCTYTLANSLFVTMMSATESVYYSRAFRTEGARNRVVAVGGLITTLGATLVAVAFPILMQTMGTTRKGWSMMLLIFALPFGLLGLLRFIFVPEIVKTEKEETQKLDVQSFIRALKSSPFIYLLSLAVLLNNVISYFTTSVTAYYFQYVVGDLSMMSAVSMMGIVTPFILLFVPMLLKKITTQQLVVIGALLGAIGSFSRWFAGGNLLFLMATGLLVALGTMPVSYYGTTVMVVSCMDYHEWKTGERIEGVFSALGNVTAKIGQAFGAALVGGLMSMSHYDGILAVQSAEANTMIVALFSVIPGIMFAGIMVLMKFYTLDKKMPQIKKELAERK